MHSTGGATVSRALKDTLEEHVLDGSNDETSIKFFFYSNDTEIRQKLSEVINTHMYVLKVMKCTNIS